MADLDPLDLEIVERALQGISEGAVSLDLESDEELELALRRELAEMIRASGVSDADVLLDILIDGMAHRSSPMCLSNQATPSTVSLAALTASFREVGTEPW